jgi:hypothetical protein
MTTPQSALHTSSLTSLPLLARGKVRDNYAVGDDRILMVASDRLSAFDVILGQPIPGKANSSNCSKPPMPKTAKPSRRFCALAYRGFTSKLLSLRELLGYTQINLCQQRLKVTGI